MRSHKLIEIQNYGKTYGYCHRRKYCCVIFCCVIYINDNLVQLLHKVATYKNFTKLISSFFFGSQNFFFTSAIDFRYTFFKVYCSAHIYKITE